MVLRDKIGLYIVFLAAIGIGRGAVYSQTPSGSGGASAPLKESLQGDADAVLPPPQRLDAAAATPLTPDLSKLPVQVIDFPSALRLAGVENPQILIARQRVIVAVAERQRAAAVFLPTLNAGMNYDHHTGPLQQSSGNILQVTRSSLYAGAGANAIAAGTVNIPGVVWNGNISQSIFTLLEARQQVARRRFASMAVENQITGEVTVAFMDLLRAAGRRSVAVTARDDAQRVVFLTSGRYKAGLGTLADAERASTELDRRITDLQQADADVLATGAQLAQLLNLDPSVRLYPAEDRLIPTPVVPDVISLPQLLAIALLFRPEVAEQRTAIQQALLALDAAKILPFSPNVIVGYSGGVFGGGSNIASGATRPRFNAPLFQSSFGDFAARNDFDVVAYWTLQNMGIGNVALVRQARTQVSIEQLQRIAIFNRIGQETTQAYIRVHVAYEQMAINEKAVENGKKAYDEDLQRVKTTKTGLPIELLDSLRLLNSARYDYVDSIVGYNRAQMQLYVAVGQPPPNVLARPGRE